MTIHARRLAFAFLAALLVPLPLLAAAFTPGNLVIYRVGDGAAAVTANGTAVFLDEYTPAGALVQSIAVPATTAGSNRRLVASGTATSEGQLTRSTDSRYLVLAGYDAALATATLTTSTSAAVNRVIARVDVNGTIDTTTALTDAISGGNPRGAASTNGTDLWLSGTSTGGGIRYATLGATTSTSLTTAPTNIRAVTIAGGQLYISSGATGYRLASVGTGTPTTTGQTTTNLPGIPTASGSPYPFFLADLDAGVAGLDTMYVADDGGTIVKYSLVAGTWTSNGTITAASVRGLAATVSGTTVTLYCTYSTGTKLAKVVDTAGYNAAPSTLTVTDLATTATNTVLRGVALAPVSAGPSLSIDNVTLNEGNAGTTTFTFTVSLSAPAPAGGVTFDIATADGTATQPGDYTQKSLLAQTIPAGSSNYTFDVLVNGDTTPETNETFFVNVTNVTGGSVLDGQGQGTITNDDAAPNLTINDVLLAEGGSGTTTFTFTVSLSAPAPAGGVTFDIATADGTATQPGDYAAKNLTSQTIAAGSSTYTFDVLVNGDTTPETNETFFVNVTNVTNAIAVDAQGLGTITNDDYTPIHDIQGNGGASPLVGQSVTTRGIVTARKFNNGFFMQEPDATADADPNTSEGIFVFTSTAPTVLVGDLVQVTATVVEYAPGRGSLTELSTPTISVTSSGNALPAPVALSATLPNPAGAWDQLERLEGMRVSVASFTVTAATSGSTTEASATGSSNGVMYGVVTGVPLPLREAGIQYPDALPLPTVPRWDSNPELLRLDSDGQIGAAQLNLSGGAILTGVVGPLDYAFDRYTLLPDTTTPPSVTAGMAATAVTTPLTSEFTVASYNLERFFDTVNDPAITEPVLTPTAYANRLGKASLGIRDYLKTPDVVGVAEVENLTTLQDIATKINADAVAAAQPNPLYVAYLVEGNDVGGIDVGFLVKTATVVGTTPRVEVLSVTQELDGTLFTNPDTTTVTLNDRPPLRLQAVIHHPNGSSHPVTVIVNHLRSMSGVDDATAGTAGWTTEGDRVRAKRLAQAVDLANLVQARQVADPNEWIVLVGDFNAFDVNDGYGDSMSTIAGVTFPDNTTTVPGDGTDLVNPDFVNLATTAPAAERYSFVFDGTRQSLDHVLVNSALVAGTSARRLEHARINADFPENSRSLYGPTDATRLSDHDPLVAFFSLATFPVELISFEIE